MAAVPLFEHQLAFVPAEAAALLRQLPEAPGLLALFGHDAGGGEFPTHGAAQPFLTRTANVRRRAQRLLTPPLPREQALAPDGTPLPSRRLNLHDRVGRVAWQVTGSEFESLLTLYSASVGLFGLPEARRRLKLRTPFVLRFARENAHPRLYVSNRLSARSLDHSFGPFASRAAAERYCDAVLDLFKLRRCYEDLQVHPDHPGCAYGEMKRCLAPCNTSCTTDAYAAEADAVESFLATGGASLLTKTARERDGASEEMDFERAAALHRQYEKVKAAAALADPLIRPVSELRAAITQAATRDPEHPEVAAIFLLERGLLSGPKRLSTLGVRAVREQTSVGSSLFAQPLMLQAVPLAPESLPTLEDAASNQGSLGEASVSPGTVGAPVPAGLRSAAPLLSPEDRAATALALLERQAAAPTGLVDPALLSDHLALLRRWYFRPEKQRAGELFLPNPDGSWPLRRILRGAARAVLGDPTPMQKTDREGAREMKTKLLHAGREGVERAVPVFSRRPGGSDASSEASAPPAVAPPVFRSRRSRRSTTGASQSPDPADKLGAP